MRKYQFTITRETDGFLWDDIKLEYQYQMFLSHNNTITNDNGQVQQLQNAIDILANFYDTKAEEKQALKEARAILKELDKDFNVFEVDIYTSDSYIRSYEQVYLYNESKTLTSDDLLKRLEDIADKIVITSKDIKDLDYFKDVFEGNVYDIVLDEIVTCKCCASTSYDYVDSVCITGDRDDIEEAMLQVLRDMDIKEEQLVAPIDEIEVTY